MAKDDIIIKAELQIAKAKTNIKSLKNELKSLDMRYTESKEKVAVLANEERKLARGKELLTQRNKELTLSQGKLGNSTGAATAATLELGRTISDMPYGIRGVANNLSQFASQFSFMANKVDATTGKVAGFSGALKNLKHAIKANAVLLIIQSVISAFDYFAGSVSKAEKSFDSFSDTVSKGYVKVAKIEALNNIMTDTNSTLEQQQSALADLKKLGYEPANQEIGVFIENQKKLVVVRAAMKAAESELQDLYKERLQVFSKFRKEFADLTKLSEEGGFGQDISKAILDELKLDKQEIDRKEKELKKEFQRLIKRSLEFDSDGDGTINKISPFKTKEALKLDVENNLSAQQKLQRQTELINLKTEEKLYINSVQSEEDKLAYKEFYAQKRLEIELDYELKGIDAKETAEKESVRKKATIRIKQLEDDLVKYKKNLKDKGVADTAAGKESIDKATKEVEEKVALTKTEAERTVQQITEKYAALFPFWTQMADARRDALGVGSTEEGADENPELNKISVYIESYKTLMSGLTQFLDGEFERQLTIEQNKTNILNKELNDRLINENLSAEQRKNIQNQIAQNDENLRVKQDAINKKKFKQTKALNLSMALIDTYAGATQVLADKKLPSWAKIPMMVSIIGAGLAQVAAISRQKFQSSSANTPINTGGGGAGGGTTERAEPSFNIVGRSNDNLLINAIQAQFDKPLKAYVVSRDVTNQQQLDGMIVSQAGT